MESKHDTCPICKRNRRDVAVESAGRGYQVALGKRTSCAECGPKVQEVRDARRSAHNLSFTPPRELFKSLRKECAELSKIKARLKDEIEQSRKALLDVREMGFFDRLRFIVTGKLPE